MLWSKEKVAVLSVVGLDFNINLNELFDRRTVESLVRGGYIREDKGRFELTKVGKNKLSDIVAFAENRIP